MRPQLLLPVAFWLVQTTTNPPALQTPKASIDGTVTSSATGEPLERAQVVLNRILPPPPPPAPGQAAAPVTPPPQIVPAMTEKDGKFKFEVEPGQYRLRVQRNGYATLEYGQRALGAAGTVITLTAGQAMKEVSMKMVAAGVVTGRVRDSRGEAVAGVQVLLMRSIYNNLGQRTFTSSGAGSTDDRGEYRIFWIPPGRYVVSVASATTSLALLVLGGPSIVSDRTFPTTYYPGTTEPARAVTLDLQPGRELTGIDIIVNPPPLFRVRGRVIDGATGEAPRSASVSLMPRQPVGNDILLLTSSSGSTTYNPNGTFEIRNVLPGSYWLRAQMATNLDQPINPTVVANVRNASELLDTVLGTRAAAQIPLDVAADVDGVSLALVPGISIPMKLSVEGQDITSIGYDRIRINLRPTAQGLNTAIQRSAFAADGTGTLSNVQAGEYRLQASIPQGDLYLKEARFERTDVLNDPWQVTGSTSGTLTIVLSSKAGQIEGNLSDALSQRVSGNQVLLIPEQNRDRPELYKTTISDANGHFTFQGIAPGEYRVYSWEAIEPNAWYDRDVLSRYEQQGKLLRIQEGSKETIEIKVIPAGK